MEPVRVGIAGYGNGAKYFHVPYLINNPAVKLVAVLQRTPVSDEHRNNKFKPHCTIDLPHVKHHTSAEEFFNDEEIELVVVTTGHIGHAKVAEQALRAGKHAVVEKPFTVTSEEADDLIKVRDETGKVLAPFQNRRYDSDTQTMLKVVSAGYLGEIHEVEIHYDLDQPAWAKAQDNEKFIPGKGQGNTLGLGVHIIDQALALFGRPKSVTGFLRGLLNPTSNVDDSCTIILQYSDKPLIVTVKLNMKSAMKRQLKYFIRGSEGTFTKYGDDQQESAIFSGRQSGSEGFGVEPEEIYGILETRKQVLENQIEDGGYWKGKVVSEVGDYRRYYQDVAKAIRGQGKLVIEPEVSRDGVRIAELARLSSDEGRTVAFD